MFGLVGAPAGRDTVSSNQARNIHGQPLTLDTIRCDKKLWIRVLNRENALAHGELRRLRMIFNQEHGSRNILVQCRILNRICDLLVRRRHCRNDVVIHSRCDEVISVIFAQNGLTEMEDIIRRGIFIVKNRDGDGRRRLIARGPLVVVTALSGRLVVILIARIIVVLVIVIGTAAIAVVVLVVAAAAAIIIVILIAVCLIVIPELVHDSEGILEIDGQTRIAEKICSQKRHNDQEKDGIDRASGARASKEHRQCQECSSNSHPAIDLDRIVSVGIEHICEFARILKIEIPVSKEKIVERTDEQR